jgi:hypothetical protein
MMFWWPIDVAASASRWKRATTSGFWALDGDALLDEKVLAFVDGAHAAFAEQADDTVAVLQDHPDLRVRLLRRLHQLIVIHEVSGLQPERAARATPTPAENAPPGAPGARVTANADGRSSAHADVAPSAPA